MKKILCTVGLTAVMIGPALAIDAVEARQFLMGAWTGSGETWIFSEDDGWQQFVGGTSYPSRFTTEAMPENLFVLVSGTTGKRYVVHTGASGSMMSVFLEGETRSLGTYWRRD